MTRVIVIKGVTPNAHLRTCVIKIIQIQDKSPNGKIVFPLTFRDFSYRSTEKVKKVFNQTFQIIEVILRKRLLKTSSKNSYPFKSYAYLNFGLEIFPQNRLEKLKIDSIQQCIIL